MAQKNELGKKGEEIAYTYLKKLGYEIREQNWIYDHAEIDLIAFDGKELVIVEVKTRSAVIYEEPGEAVSSRKIRFLVHAAEAYIMENNLNVDTRFDVIGIKWYGHEKYSIEHFKDAFSPPVF